MYQGDQHVRSAGPSGDSRFVQWFLDNSGSRTYPYPKDNIDIVDCGKIVEIAEALNWLIREWEERS